MIALARGLAAALLLFCVGCGPASPAGFRVEAELCDGRTVSGRIEAETIPLELTTPGGELVEIELRAPEPRSSLLLAADVEQIPERHVYSIRAASFTAEAIDIKPPLALLLSDGRHSELEWGEISRARFSAMK